MAVTRPAHAYVDPGVASIVLQVIIGGIAVGGLFFRNKIMQVARLFRFGKAPKNDALTHSPLDADDN